VSETVEPALVIVRFFTFGLAILLFGAATFAVYAPAEPRPDAGLRIVAPGLLALAAAAYAVLLGREASGSGDWPTPTLMVDIYTSTGFGRALAAMLVGALALGLSGAFARNPRWLRVALSGSTIVALAFVGHAADDSGVRGDARLLLMALHLMAIGAWLGALPLLRRALARRPPDATILLNRFGLVGGVCVVLVLATGFGTLAFTVIDARGALGADYARVLALKLAFVLGLFALAAVNRFRLTPMMSRDPERARLALRQTIMFEQGLGLCALASVALLGQLDPTM
jgi:putative copper resistance protein D